jgi:hypothetical protein
LHSFELNRLFTGLERATDGCRLVGLEMKKGETMGESNQIHVRQMQTITIKKATSTLRPSKKSVEPD